MREITNEPIRMKDVTRGLELINLAGNRVITNKIDLKTLLLFTLPCNNCLCCVYNCDDHGCLHFFILLCSFIRFLVQNLASLHDLILFHIFPAFLNLVATCCGQTNAACGILNWSDDSFELNQNFLQHLETS